jgi:bifunctional non-homologous end joining protein LigD
MALSETLPRGLNLTNLDKVFFPATGFTKGDMIRYYAEVAPVMVSHLRGRPVTVIRFPNGVRGKHFYEKNAPRFAPDWVQTAPVPRSEGKDPINYILINDVKTLLWCANLASIELHPFLHRAANLDRPTHLAFDLDPGEGASLLQCIEVGWLVKELLGSLGLETFPKVSGSKGLQLYVPLNTPTSYETTKPFSNAVARVLEDKHPTLIVSNMAKALRKNRVLIDWSQNDDKKTTVSVYSLRAKRESPFVSMPVTWEELDRAHAQKNIERLQFSPQDALKRVAKHGDLFAPVLGLKQKLPTKFVVQPASVSRPRARARKRAARA